VVFTRNQNVRSGINRLKAYLGYDASADTAKEILEKLGREDVLIAVSAQGEGTTKLVGIVEMAKRVVGGLDENEEGGGGDRGGGGGETWYMYTSLASRGVERVVEGGEEKVVQRKESDGERQQEDGEIDTQSAQKSRRTPVLTAWLSKTRIPSFKKAFGEQTFEVRRPRPQEEQ
jgi:hypothetical protein